MVFITTNLFRFDRCCPVMSVCSVWAEKIASFFMTNLIASQQRAIRSVAETKTCCKSLNVEKIQLGFHFILMVPLTHSVDYK